MALADFEGNISKLARKQALDERRAVRQFEQQGGTYLDDIARQINDSRARRLAAREAVRGLRPSAAPPAQGVLGAGGGQGAGMAVRGGVGVAPTGQPVAQGVAGNLPTRALPGMPQQLALPAAGQTTVGQGAGMGLTPGNPMVQNAGQISHSPIGQSVGQVANVTDDAASIAGRTIGGTGRALGTTAASPVDDIISSVAGGAAGGAGGAVPPTIGGAGAAGAGAAGDAAGMGASAAGRAGMLANVTRASLMKGAGVAGAGYMASGVIDSMNLGGENSAWDRGGTGAVLGAGLGAGGAIALGLGTGPVGWAALGGAALFAGGKLLFGDKETTPEKMRGAVDETRDSIRSIAGMYGLSEDAVNDIMIQFDTSAALYLDNEDREGLKAYLTGLTQTLPAQMYQSRMMDNENQRRDNQYERMIQIQADFAPIFEDQLTRASQASETAMTMSNQSADALASTNPNLAALIRQGGAQGNESSQRLYAAYAQQMAMGPQQAANAEELNYMMQAQDALLQQMTSPIG